MREALYPVIREIKSAVTERLDLSVRRSDEEVRDLILTAVMDQSRRTYIALPEKQQIAEHIFNAMRRLDVLQPLLQDPTITEIMVNNHEEIFIERCGITERSDVYFESRERLEHVIQSIVASVNRSVNESVPIVDARLPDGSRVSVVLPPVALKGPALTIRKFPERPFSPETMTANGTLTEEALNDLARLVRARYNILVSGGTGSGKTTFLNLLSGFIPANERIVTIEDSAELQLTSIENLVSLETRNPNTEGKGEITIRDLIRSSLRMRPDRIVVGEVRGAEALDMLQAMNTGHEGSLSTAHANSTQDMISRLETMVLTAAVLPIDVIRRQIASAIDVIIHLGRLRDGSRRVMEIVEIVDCISGEIVLNPLFELKPAENAVSQEIMTLQRAGMLIHGRKMASAGLAIQEAAV
ncbi:MAG: CpaF family protein [Solirubrobacterales bacterium]